MKSIQPYIVRTLDVEAIGLLRAVRNLSVVGAAEAAGFKNYQQWSQIENGRHTNVTTSTLNAIAKALDCDPRHLLK